MNHWVWLSLFGLTSLFGDVENLMQTILSNTDASKMKKIDFIYLDERPEKLPITMNALAPYEIFLCRFSAINGWKLSFAGINDVGFRYDLGTHYGSYSMILLGAGIRKVLTFLKRYNPFLAYDLQYTMPVTINLFTVLHDLVSTQPRTLSDNGKPTYDLT